MTTRKRRSAATATVNALTAAVATELRVVQPGETAVAETFQTVSPRNTLNDLTAREWIPETISVWTQKGLGAGHPEAQIERQHPAPFSFSDVRRLVRFFTKRGATVLDPFVGVGSTLKACALEGRNGIGIELNPKYATLARKRLTVEVPPLVLRAHPQRVIKADARHALKTLPSSSVDFVVTSPPYGNNLHKEDHKARQERQAHDLDTRYSDDPRDLGNEPDYGKFLSQLVAMLVDAGRVLKPRQHMAVVVSDFRQGSRFVMFHADLARALEEHAVVLKGITILWQKQKRIFPYGYPAAFVPNVHHQYILILRNEKSAAAK